MSKPAIKMQVHLQFIEASIKIKAPINIRVLTVQTIHSGTAKI